jgi:23S rRNA pseudouridine2604 synthase
MTDPVDPPVPVRLSKLLAQRGLCSRREADAFIERGLVLVDGQPVNTLGLKVLPTQQIELSAEARGEQGELVTLLLNKPVGYVSGQPEPGYHPAAELLTNDRRMEETTGPVLGRGSFEGLAPAGRLDIDSTGLLVFTQDGRLARRLTGDHGEIEKEYLVRVTGTLDDRSLNLLRHGLELDGRPLRPAQVEWLNRDQLRFVICEGRKRQIRRMCELVGLKVTGLKRVRIGKVRLGKLPEGQWRHLRPGETF